MFENEIEKIFEEIKQILIRKNSDYQNSFSLTFREYGLQSVHIRLTDKLNRLKYLATNEAEIENETIENVLQDIIGYSILTLLEIKKKDGYY